MIRSDLGNIISEYHKQIRLDPCQRCCFSLWALWLFLTIHNLQERRSNMNTKTNIAMKYEEQELVITREFNAPRSLVWKVFLP